PLQLAKHCDRAGDRLVVAIERCALMGVLAVAHVLDLFTAEMKGLRIGVRAAIDIASGEPVRDSTVVGSGVGGGLLHQPESGRVAERAAAFAELVEYARVIGRIDDDTDMGPVLRGGAYHRRTTDVDVLDRFRERAAGARNRLPERIQIDDDEIDGR